MRLRGIGMVGRDMGMRKVKVDMRDVDMRHMNMRNVKVSMVVIGVSHIYVNCRW